MNTIISNAAFCRNCNEIVASEEVEPPVSCSCNNVKVWGGHEYIAHSARNVAKYRNWSIEMDRNEVNEYVESKLGG